MCSFVRNRLLLDCPAISWCLWTLMCVLCALCLHSYRGNFLEILSAQKITYFLFTANCQMTISGIDCLCRSPCRDTVTKVNCGFRRKVGTFWRYGQWIWHLRIANPHDCGKYAFGRPLIDLFNTPCLFLLSRIPFLHFSLQPMTFF